MTHSRAVHILAATLPLLALAGTVLAQIQLPPGFTDTVIASVASPTGLAFTPDGRILITTQHGILRVYQGGALVPGPALDLGPVLCNNRERGLLGVAVDPQFASNSFIYLFYTFNLHGSAAPCPEQTGGGTPVNRVSRFVLPAGNVIDPASETVLIDNIASPGANHNAGDLQFGADGLLYVSTGDGAMTPMSARDLALLNGKILRIQTDGLVPPGNPYVSAPGARRCGDPAGQPPGTGPCQEVFARGLRNPFRIAFRPGTSEFHINDVGENRWEEIDLGQIDADYGWNVREGPCSLPMPTSCGPPPAGMTNPIYAYDHTGGCTSITGGAFVPAAAGWPAPYDGAYLYGELVCGKIVRLEPDGGGGFNGVDFLTNLGRGSVVAMAFGPDGPGSLALYWTDYTPGRIHRVRYVGGANRPPIAAATALPSWGAVPLMVAFDGAASSDPDLDALTYDWDFGDGTTAPGLTTPTTSHTYTSPAVRTATLVVHDGRGGDSAPFAIRIDAGNTPPTPSIQQPTPATRFHVGEAFALTGAASDLEDGAVPSSSLSWEAVLHHVDEQNPTAAHTHPLLPPTAGNGVPLVAPAPEDLQATRLSRVELFLTATDSWGLAATVAQDLLPNRVDLTFDTMPSGLGLTLIALPVTAPTTIVSWEDFALPVGLASPVQQDAGGTAYRFALWSDSGAADHVIATPPIAASYTATFVPAADLAFAPSLLRNDLAADLAAAPALLPAVFARSPADPSLEEFGPNRLGDAGEGALTAGNGSSDDDACYVHGVVSGDRDPEAAVLADALRPLVFYQLDQAGPTRVLRLVKAGGAVALAY